MYPGLILMHFNQDTFEQLNTYNMNRTSSISEASQLSRHDLISMLIAEDAKYWSYHILKRKIIAIHMKLFAPYKKAP